MLRFHILANNYVRKRGLLAEHGLSILIEHNDRKILFDTGQSNVYIHNAQAMGVDLEDIDAIVLSHGHYDHTGGVPYFPFNKCRPVLYVHQEALAFKYSQQEDGGFREIGIPWKLEEIPALKDHIIFNTQSLRLYDNCLILGEIPSTTDFEAVPRDFMTVKDGKLVRDMLLDEQMLIIDGEMGITVFLGCSHPGVINCLKYACKLYPGKKLNAVVGGMHLDGVSPISLQRTIEYFDNMGIERVVPLHCTGINASYEMRRFLGDRCIQAVVGDAIQLDD